MSRFSRLAGLSVALVVAAAVLLPKLRSQEADAYGDKGELRAMSQKLPKQETGMGAEREADAGLVRSLLNVEVEDAIHSDSGEQEADQAEHPH